MFALQPYAPSKTRGFPTRGVAGGAARYGAAAEGGHPGWALVGAGWWARCEDQRLGRRLA